jgi:hypothetical protein
MQDECQGPRGESFCQEFSAAQNAYMILGADPKLA